MDIRLKHEAIVNGVRRKSGDSVTVDQQTLKRLVEIGVVGSVEEAQKNMQREIKTEVSPQETRIEKEHVGGGYYRFLKNGEEITEERVRGEEQAEEKRQQLEG